MSNYIKILNEGKQVGKIYHFTTADGLFGILKMNKIIANRIRIGKKAFNAVSFTRNKNFLNVKRLGLAGNQEIIGYLSVDGNKLSNNYKIIPFNYYTRIPPEHAVDLDKLTYDEDEEIVAKDVLNVDNYITEIVLFKNALKNSRLTDIDGYIDKIKSLTSKPIIIK